MFKMSNTNNITCKCVRSIEKQINCSYFNKILVVRSVEAIVLVTDFTFLGCKISQVIRFNNIKKQKTEK